jgi:hypothetical protein
MRKSPPAYRCLFCHEWRVQIRRDRAELEVFVMYHHSYCINRKKLHRYSKAENLTLPIHYTQYSHLLTSNPTFHSDHFDKVDHVDGYSRLAIQPRNIMKVLRECNVWMSHMLKGNYRELLEYLPAQIVLEPKVYIMERKWFWGFDHSDIYCKEDLFSIVIARITPMYCFCWQISYTLGHFETFFYCYSWFLQCVSIIAQHHTFRIDVELTRYSILIDVTRYRW